MKNKNYPLYNVEKVNNLKELVNFAEEKYGNKPAFTFERKNERVSVSYTTFKNDTDALGTALFDLGIKNTRIALIGENSYEWIVAYLATVNGGNTIVPLDKELPLTDLNNILIDCQASVLIYSDDYRDIADGLTGDQIHIKHKFNMKSDLSGLIERGRVIIGTDRAFVEYDIDNNSLATILYTSGTTGAPKGVMLSHYNIACDVVKSCQNIFFFGVSLLVLPLHHSFAFTCGVLIMLYRGCDTVINKSLKDVAGNLLKFKPNNAFLVPLYIETFYKKVWENARKTGRDALLERLIKVSNCLLKLGIDLRPKLFKKVLASFGGELDVIVSGGAPIDAAYIKGFRDLGLKVRNGYGISECSPVVSVNRNHYCRDGSVGTVLPGLDVKILEPDENGRGEICVKGDIVMLGYYNNERATKDAFDDGWFKTGDIGYLDKDGFLFITGRKKNLIILSNGKNIQPEDVESSLSNITYIKESVVYADNDMIVAEVFLDTENEPDCAALLDKDIVKLNKTLPAYKNIGKTVIRDTEFPKTTTKKIKR